MTFLKLAAIHFGLSTALTSHSLVNPNTIKILFFKLKPLVELSTRGKTFIVHKILTKQHLTGTSDNFKGPPELSAQHWITALNSYHERCQPFQTLLARTRTSINCKNDPQKTCGGIKLDWFCPLRLFYFNNSLETRCVLAAQLFMQSKSYVIIAVLRRNKWPGINETWSEVLTQTSSASCLCRIIWLQFNVTLRK